MNKIFDTVRERAPKKSAFDLSHEKKLSAQFGKLYPILLQEVVPGDQFKGRVEALVRMAPMIAPIMHMIDVFFHFFNVPNRIIWDSWEEFITGGDKGDTLVVKVPTHNVSTVGQIGKGTLLDYMGIPIVAVDALAPLEISQLPVRAYHEIWNEYYRDQNLQEPQDITLIDGSWFDLHIRAYEKDYFTSALPYPQKGPAVPLPVDSQYTPQYKPVSQVLYDDGNPTSEADVNVEGGLAGEMYLDNGVGTLRGRIENLEDEQFINSTSITIEELRRASRLQEWLEVAARAGTRYKELIKSMFGVSVGDARLDRPEYLGGGKQSITISEVLNTTGVEGQAPQGDMAGHGISVGSSTKWYCDVKEHGHILGIMSIVPKKGYQQGVERLWTRGDKFTFYWEKFSNLGEQEVLNKELYNDYVDATENEATFGYQPIYSEYKYNQNTVHGDFRDELDFWHLSQKFDALPVLNEDFIKVDNVPLDEQIFAVTDPTIDKFYIQLYNQVKARRPMPYFSNPTL